MKNLSIERLTLFSLDYPKTIIGFAVFLTVIFSIQFPRIIIDTDPENMLEPDQAERVFYDNVKNEFGIHDMIVVGIVDERGIFRPKSLERIARATERILGIKGVIAEDVVSLTTTDNVKSIGGLLDIRPVMDEVPLTQEGAERLSREIAANPFLHEKIASEDSTAVALYVPIEKKDMSYRIAGEIDAILKEDLLRGQTYHLAGLPVAEDTFGNEMFIQMAIVAPIAFVAIMLLIFLLFQIPGFLLPIGISAMFAVIWAMGLLIGTGHTVHIMSSMIPVFLMPIAILDNIHIISGFSDRYRVLGDKRSAIIQGMRPLYIPMLYTSLTSAVGFASLALADIPPVQVFGLFVAFGIIAAWFFSMTIVPALISLMDEGNLKKALWHKGTGLPLQSIVTGSEVTLLGSIISAIGEFAFLRAKTIIILNALLIAIAIFGISQIQVNDNPVKWFKESHPMRIADTVMNRVFGGTYMAYIVVQGNGPDAIKSPKIVNYIASVQSYLEEEALVGKTSSVADIVKRINLVLHDNDPFYHTVPDSESAIGQFLFLFQSSGDPDDLDNFVNADSSAANIWVQMKGGDNRQMQFMEDRLNLFMLSNPPPAGIKLRWSGLTYINKVWQDLMVFGMLKAILGSFVVVFFLMLIEFRSLSIGALSMVPLTLAILLSYGLIGLIGKDYDMPIAVCSSLSLGLGIDFAIHFLHRFQSHYRQTGNLKETNRYVFGEPGLAIARNAIVISIGFLPLAASTLTPYITVGVFFALLMLFSALSTLFILPAALHIAGHRILSGGKR